MTKTGAPKIVIIQNHLGELGGLSTFADLLSRGLLSAGYEVEIGAVTPSPGGALQPFDARVSTWSLVDEFIPQNRSTWPPQLSNRRAALRRARFDHKVRKAAETKFATYDKRTIIVSLQIFAYEVAWSTRKALNAGYSIVAMYHGSFHAAEAGTDLAAMRRLYSSSDAFVCLSGEDAMLFAKSGISHAEHIYNPVTLPPQDQVSPLNAHTIVSLSRYDKVKQVDHMIRAMAALPPAASDWQLHLYGYGPEESALRHLIDDLDLGSRVKIKGWVTDASTVLRQSSLSLNTSHSEGFSFAILEASAHGVPTLAYESSPGLHAMIDDKVSGIIVPQGDEALFQRTLSELVTDPTRLAQLGSAARTHVIRHFSLDRIVENWGSLFERLITSEASIDLENIEP